MSVHTPHTQTCTHTAGRGYLLTLPPAPPPPKSPRRPWKLGEPCFILDFPPTPEARHPEVSRNKELKAYGIRHIPEERVQSEGLLDFLRLAQKLVCTL